MHDTLTSKFCSSLLSALDSKDKSSSHYIKVNTNRMVKFFNNKAKIALKIRPTSLMITHNIFSDLH